MPFHRLPAAAAAMFLAAASLAAQADTVINIQGFGADGAGTVSPLTYPLAAGTVIALSNPVLLALPAGNYSLVDAWGLPGALYDAWNFQSSAPGSWASHYVAALAKPDGLFSVLVDGVSLLDPSCSNHFCAWDTQAQAAAAFAATPAYSFTLAQAGAVAFVSADYFLPDNLGGISLLLSAAPVPEPASWALLAAGLGLMLGLGSGLRVSPGPGTGLLKAQRHSHFPHA